MYYPSAFVRLLVTLGGIALLVFLPLHFLNAIGNGDIPSAIVMIVLFLILVPMVLISIVIGR